MLKAITNPFQKMTTRQILTALGLLFFSWANGQADQFKKLLRTDPYLSNGYFIVDKDKCAALGVTQLEIEIFTYRETSGLRTKTTLKSFTMVPADFFKDADLGSIKPNMLAGETAYYRLKGKDKDGKVVEDYQATGVGGDDPWPQRCHLICNAPGYSWNLRAFSSGGQTYIDMVEGTNDGSYYYFYVKDTEWNTFTQQHLPSEFGFMQQWSVITSLPQTDIIHLTAAAGGAPMMPMAWMGTKSLWALRCAGSARTVAPGGRCMQRPTWPPLPPIAISWTTSTMRTMRWRPQWHCPTRIFPR